MAFLATNDLAQIGLSEKAHRRAGAVVQIGRLGDKLLARLLDKTDVRCGTQDRITQLLGRNPLERIIEGQGVNEDGAGNVDRIGRQAAVMAGVDLLCQCLFPNRSGGDIVGNSRHVSRLPEACHDLLADRFVARIDMVKVNRCGIPGFLLPKMRDGPCQ